MTEKPIHEVARTEDDSAHSEREKVAELEKELKEAIGIGEGCNDGPEKYCGCGRRMVWQYVLTGTGAPSWMCPNCVLRRMDKADGEIADLRRQLAEEKTMMRKSEKIVVDLEWPVRDVAEREQRPTGERLGVRVAAPPLK